MKLFETTKDDVEIKEGVFIPLAREGPQGVRC